MSPTFQIEGVDVFVEGQGEEALVMIHGWPDTHRLWDAQVAHLQASHRCVRFTLPGFDAAKPHRACGLEAMIALFKAIVERASPGRPVVLMLHDWGCVFGYQFLMRHPELVSRVVAVDIGDAGSPAHIRALSAKAKLMVMGYQLWLALAWRLRGSLGTRMTRYMARRLQCPSDPQLIHAGMNYGYDIAWTGSHGGYRQMKPVKPPCPLLYLYGMDKPFMFHSPAWAEALAARPGSQVQGFATGHWVMSAQPQAFNEAVSAWLASSAQTSSSASSS